MDLPPISRPEPAETGSFSIAPPAPVDFFTHPFHPPTPGATRRTVLPWPEPVETGSGPWTRPCSISPARPEPAETALFPSHPPASVDDTPSPRRCFDKRVPPWREYVITLVLEVG